MPRKAPPKPRVPNKPKTAMLPLPQYKSLIEGLMSQGLPHADAVETLRAGLREANGRPARQETALA
jgi:hypothetical protein